ncbi:hypothetical protein ACKWTF_006706 [Chironomus riparius]
MRYAKENEFMERDGSKEDETDWDSLSDRVKKNRRQFQKAVRESAERKDALTNRPLDFDREEETRRKETYKWLDSHFGSESTSKDSRDDSFSDVAVEPTKKTYFNVTIKSNNNVNNNNHHHNVTHTSSSSSLTNNISNQKITTSAHRQSNSALDNDLYPNKLSAPSKVYMPEREPAPQLQSSSNKKTFFQGISDWSERKETPRPIKAHPLSSKAFQDELSGTLERKQRMIKLSQGSSHNDIRNVPSTAAILNGNSGNKLNDPKIMKYKSSSRDDLLKTQKEDLGYLSGSRTELRVPRKYTNDDYAVPIKTKKTSTNGYLHREDSGFRDSKEDLRSPAHREDSFGHDDVKQTSIQRDDSAYVSSSTYFTTPRSPRRPRSPIMTKTPDSGIRSPTPTNDFESDELNQSPPAVPQRKKAMERKMRSPIKNSVDYANSPAKPRRDPPIDYSPPPRSRSVSPLPPIHHVYSDRKSYQKTRFSSPPSVSRSMQTQTLPPKKKSVGNAIGNSIRKLVGKIRSASAERKLKAKTPPTSSSKRSPSPLPMLRHRSVSNLPLTSSSYQRNDYVDSHITNGYKRAPSTSTQASTNGRRERTVERNERSGSSTTDNEMPATSERTVTTHHQKKTVITSPKKSYYLGENPYGGSLFGKENKFVANGSPAPRESEIVKQKNYYNQSHSPARRLRSEEPTLGSNVTTLGRFSKSTNRLTSNGLTSTPSSKNGYESVALNESNENYRSSQTLPRKLEHHKQKPISQSTINVSIVNNVKNHPVQNTGPAKPARTYKALQRSKSFNVHGMNGTNDPSPIYMEKLTNNNYKNYPMGQQKIIENPTPERVITTTTTHHSIYKSTPHLNGHLNEIKLKSPSIVNLISRSTRDLTQLNGSDHQYIDRRYNSSPFTNDIKKSTNGRNGIEEEVLSRNIKFAERDSSGSKASSRSSPIVGKDSPIGILRRSSNSTDNDNYSETFKYQTLSNDPVNPTVTDTVETFTKKTIIPGDQVDARTKKETVVERHEIKKVTTSRHLGSPSPTSLKYYDINHQKNGNGGVVIELRNNY